MVPSAELQNGMQGLPNCTQKDVHMCFSIKQSCSNDGVHDEAIWYHELHFEN